MGSICKAKKDVKDERYRAIPLSFNVFLENPTEYPHKPYIARNYSACTTSAPVTVSVYLHQFSRNYFSKIARPDPAEPARKQFNAK